MISKFHVDSIRTRFPKAWEAYRKDVEKPTWASFKEMIGVFIIGVLIGAVAGSIAVVTAFIYAAGEETGTDE